MNYDHLWFAAAVVVITALAVYARPTDPTAKIIERVAYANAVAAISPLLVSISKFGTSDFWMWFGWGLSIFIGGSTLLWVTRWVMSPVRTTN